jgi:hypothetical protein
MASRDQQDLTLVIVDGTANTKNFQDLTLVVGPTLNPIGAVRNRQDLTLVVATSPAATSNPSQLWIIT